MRIFFPPAKIGFHKLCYPNEILFLLNLNRNNKNKLAVILSNSTHIVIHIPTIEMKLATSGPLSRIYSGNPLPLGLGEG